MKEHYDRGRKNMIDRVEQKTNILIKGGVKTENERSIANGYPLPLMPKGERREA